MAHAHRKYQGSRKEDLLQPIDLGTLSNSVAFLSMGFPSGVKAEREDRGVH